MPAFNHYIPILRWKAAEREALQNLTPEQKASITPLIEIIMPRPKTYKKGSREKTPEELLAESIDSLRSALPKIPTNILKAWGSASAILEVGLVHVDLRAEALREILALGEKVGVHLVPAIGLNSDPKTVQVAVALAKKYGHGMCIRLFRSDLAEKALLPNRIKQFLGSCGIAQTDIDLILDYQITDQSDSQYQDLPDVCEHIPELPQWRTFTVASGAFPPDLVNFDVNLHKIPRYDWMNWIAQVKSGNLRRKPYFADYTIQHPLFKEPVRGANPSASIRYTIPEEWMIMRGRGLRSPKSNGHAQYPALAQLLLIQKEFCKGSFSFGDEYVETVGASLKTKKTGNPRTWLRAGINHHLAMVVSQLSNLS